MLPLAIYGQDMANTWPKMNQKQKTNDIGLVPAWFEQENNIIDFDKHLFNVNVDEIEQVRFETKWAPDPNVILAISVKTYPTNISFIEEAEFLTNANKINIY